MKNNGWLPILLFGIYFPIFFILWPFLKLGLVYLIATIESVFGMESGNASGYILIVAPLLFAIAGGIVYVFVSFMSKLMELAVKIIKKHIFETECINLSTFDKILYFGIHTTIGLLTFWIYQENLFQLPFLSDLYDMFRPLPRNTLWFLIAVVSISTIHGAQFNRWVMKKHGLTSPSSGPASPSAEG